MKRILFTAVATIAVIIVVVGCGIQTNNDLTDSTFTTVPASERMKEIAARNVPDGRSVFVGKEAVGLQPLALGANLFDNAGFESNLTGWTGCETGAIQPSTDSHTGDQALQINPNNCFYRSAEVSVGQELVLSCHVKVRNGTGWTGMGMSFEDDTFSSIQAAPTVVATSGDYMRYETRGVAPADSKYLSMWVFSENDVVVDDCSLAVEDGTPVLPPTPSGDNLLENGMFESLNATNRPVEWMKGCGGTWASEAGRSGNGLNIADGACIDQSLSSEEAAGLSGTAYTYSCYAKHSSGYASLTLFLDGQASSTVIPVSSEYQRIELSGNAPSSISNAFVSLYSEGSTTIDDCVLITETTTPPTSSDNLLINGTFENLNGAGEPTDWLRGCGGTWSSTIGRSGNAVSISGGACVDQSMDTAVADSLNGQEYSYSCYVKNSGGYASISIFLNEQATSKVIPVSSDFQRIELSGTAPSTTNSAFVSLYSEGQIVVDDCELSISSPNSETSPELIDYQENLSKWQAQNIDDYEFVFQRICFCIRDVTRPVRISVQDDIKVSVRKVETYQDVSADQFDFYRSIDEIFALIKDAIDRDVTTLNVEYDSVYGYPTSLYIDYDERIADEEVSIQASYLSATPNGQTALPTSCEAYSTDSYEYNANADSNVPFATVQLLPVQNDMPVDKVNVCVRSLHNNGCTDAVQVSSSFEDGAFKLVRTVSDTLNACTAAITPYAKLVELDVSGLESGSYPINYYSSPETTSPQIETSFQLDNVPTPPIATTCSGSASYTFSYTNNWTASTHPYQFTDDPHFSPFIGANHKNSYTLWATGSMASQGVQDVAELGQNGVIETELTAAVNAGNAEQVVFGGSLNPALAGSQRSFTVTVSSDHSQVSFVSMLAPSPDWFIGLNGLELCQNGQWIESVSRDAFVYDSGTDDGVIYDSADAPSNPRQVITRLNELPFVVNGETKPVGTFTLTKN